MTHQAHLVPDLSELTLVYSNLHFVDRLSSRSKARSQGGSTKHLVCRSPLVLLRATLQETRLPLPPHRAVSWFFIPLSLRVPEKCPEQRKHSHFCCLCCPGHEGKRCHAATPVGLPVLGLNLPSWSRGLGHESLKCFPFPGCCQLSPGLLSPSTVSWILKTSRAWEGGEGGGWKQSLTKSSTLHQTPPFYPHNNP